MLITINTDASFHHKYKVGAFAFWSICNSFKIQKAGYLKDLCRNPDDAEMKCIINAVYNTLSNSKEVNKIIFNTDSLNSKAVFENDRKHINKYSLFWAKKHRKKFNSIIKNYNRKNKKYFGIEIEFRHVKAHSGKKDKRSYVNEWCDKHAKAFLWKRIHELKLTPNANKRTAKNG